VKGALSAARRRPWAGLEQLGIWGALDQAVLAGSGFAITVIVARSGGPDALGTFALAQSVVLLAAGFLKAGFGDPMVLEVRGQGERSGLQGTLPLAAALGALGLVLALAWRLIGSTLMGMTPHSVAWLAMIALLPLAAFYEIARSVRLADANERGLFVGDLLVATGRLGALGLVLAGVRGLALGLAALAAGGVGSVLSVARWLRCSWQPGHLIRLWRLGRWLTGESLLYGLGAYGVWLLAVPRAGAGVVGELRAAQQLFAPVQVMAVGLNVIMLGRLAATHGRLTSAARLLGLAQLVLLTCWSCLLVVLGPAATGLLFGDRFEISRLELAVLALSVVAGAAYELAALRLRAARLVRVLVRTRFAVTLTALTMAVAIGTSFVGVVTAFLASQLLGAGLAWRAWARHYWKSQPPPTARA
jgi:O-antigen/teichoic acid export membrane protein